MIFVNFVLNEKKHAECISYSSKPSTEFALIYSKHQQEQDEFNVDLIIKDGYEFLRPIIEPLIPAMEEAALELLATIDKKQLLDQINLK